MTTDEPMPVYLDCDTGIDDVLAIAYLLGRPDVRLVGIGTVSGNIDAHTAALNTLRVLDLFGAPSIPVASGARDFLTRSYDGGAPDVHGRDGIGDVGLPESDRPLADQGAVEMLLELAHRHPGRLRVLAIGPLTNLAQALRQDPDLAHLVHDVTVMGGAFLVGGNITPHAEANIYNDPEAAAVVFDAPWQVTVVPVDVARDHRFEQADLTALAGSTSAAVRTVASMLDVYADFYDGVYGRRLAVLYDPLAAAVLSGDLEVTEDLVAPVAVTIGDGPERGRTTTPALDRHLDAPGRSSHRVVLAVEPDFAPMLVDAVQSLDEP